MKTTTIHQEVFIKAKPEAVYECFVDAKKHTDFTGSDASGAGKVGCKFTAWDGYILGKYTKLVKGKKLVCEWKTTEWPEGERPSLFELDFIPEKEGTKIIMLHSNVPLEQADELAKGWEDFYWKPLKDYFSKKKGKH
jgi:activator of HSP90 ATPase